MNKNRILEYLKNNKDYLYANYGVKKLALFGSYARGENKIDSDIDILFEIEENSKFSIFKYLKLNKYLEDVLKSKVDLVREATLKKELNLYIQKDIIYV